MQRRFDTLNEDAEVLLKIVKALEESNCDKKLDSKIQNLRYHIRVHLGNSTALAAEAYWLLRATEAALIEANKPVQQ